MPRSSLLGLPLAAFGALVLTPDALFMRLSGMDGFQMLGWRATCMGGLFVLTWLLTSRDRGGDLRALASGAALTVIACQFLNATLFSLGIASAPVAVVLVAVATVPVWAALLSHALYGERSTPATWLTIAVVLAGIALAVSGKQSGPGSALAGAACGLGVALTLAVNFVTLRHHREVPLLAAIGAGALLAGATGWAVTGPAAMTDGRVAAILVTGLVILPVSFFSLSFAARHTAAANVSLLLLLETVLAPAWVWLGTGEAPTARMAAGGAVVVTALALYLARAR